jgi:large subunit ribosomal protein L21
MYAVIEVGARQYLVKKDDIIEVELQDAEAGKQINLDKVLFVSKDKKFEVGKPYLPGAGVRALVVRQIKGKKAVSFKYRRRKASKWTKGHRQQLTRLKIEEILLG